MRRAGPRSSVQLSFPQRCDEGGSNQSSEPGHTHLELLEGCSEGLVWEEEELSDRNLRVSPIQDPRGKTEAPDSSVLQAKGRVVPKKFWIPQD